MHNNTQTHTYSMFKSMRFVPADSATSGATRDKKQWDNNTPILLGETAMSDQIWVCVSYLAVVGSWSGQQVYDASG